MDPKITNAFATGSLREVAAALGQFSPTVQPDGSRIISELLGETADCVRYTDNGVAFTPAGFSLHAPTAGEVILLTTSVSLCGTDLGLIDKAQAGQLPPETQGKVVGHEGAGFIIGLGKDVTGWEIGQFVCLDSHYACSTGEHHSFDECVASGKSCDGIAGGIRGALLPDGSRANPYDGYWSRIIIAPASALPVAVSVETAEHLIAPSTLESLGNVYMMLEQLDAVGLVEKAAETIVAVVGLGATGYPMAAVAKHYGFEAIGVDPVASKREFAMQHQTCSQVFADAHEAQASMQELLSSGARSRVAIVLSAGEPEAHQAVFDVMHALTGAAQRSVAVFGLFADAKQPMVEATAEFATLPERDFVFSRKSFTTEDGIGVYGVCGRDIASWKRLLTDLEPVGGQPPQLVAQLNAAVYSLNGADPLAEIATELQKGSKHVFEMLQSHQALKLAANLVKKA